MNVVELSVAQDDRIQSMAMMAINNFMIEFDIWEYDYAQQTLEIGYCWISSNCVFNLLSVFDGAEAFFVGQATNKGGG